MEWNQASSREDTVTEPVPLYGEIIRIGAVKLDGDLNETAQYHSCVMPKFYKKMNSIVGRVTGLRNVSIKTGIPFPEAYAQFLSWCGEELVMLAWGSEDKKVLEANLAVHGMSAEQMPEIYDLQLIFANKIACDGRQYGIMAALEYFGLPAELQAHNALNDAIYAARIGKCMEFDRYLDSYDEMIREIAERKSERYVKCFHNIGSIKEAMSSKRITMCICPKCRRIMKRKKYAYLKKDVAITVAECKEHGGFYVRIKMTRCPDGSYSVTRKMKPLSADNHRLYEKCKENVKKDEKSAVNL